MRQARFLRIKNGADNKPFEFGELIVPEEKMAWYKQQYPMWEFLGIEDDSVPAPVAPQQEEIAESVPEVAPQPPVGVQPLEVKINCPLCNKGFKNTIGLIVHRRRMHP